MEEVAYIILIFGGVLLIVALCKQLALDKAIPPETNCLGPKGQQRKRSQQLINPWWWACWTIVGVGCVLAFASRL